MINYTLFYDRLRKLKMDRLLAGLPEKIEAALHDSRQALLPKWKELISELPKPVLSTIDLNSPDIIVGNIKDCDNETRNRIYELLHELKPWKKGPYNIYGIEIDTEWRSDLKWDRLKNHIKPLNGRKVLDVGCGNGYHCWRMRGAGAELVVGIDPFLTFIAQFAVISHFVGSEKVYVLPLGIEALPEELRMFDTVFSMGVLYHRRSPFGHLLELKNTLNPGGELVLETLVIDGKKGEVLVPEGRYSKMPNVWFIPSCLTLESWLKRAGLKNIRLIDVNQTTTEEQRRTEWMEFESLSDFLDPKDSNKTIEGYPAPKRAIFLAESS
jgi:tRNA (mo5U34)-methyltransferase